MTFQPSRRDFVNGACIPSTACWAKFSRPFGTPFHEASSQADFLGKASWAVSGGDVYSARSVIEGSTWAARQAGSQHAIPETTASSAITKK